MLVSDIVRRNADFFPDSEAIVIPGVSTTTWAELEERSNRFARALLDLGLKKGDRISTFATNCGEYFDFFFACAKTGIIGATVNVRLTAPEVASYLNYVEPSAILVHADVGKRPAGPAGPERGDILILVHADEEVAADGVLDPGEVAQIGRSGDCAGPILWHGGGDLDHRW